jgi:carbamoyl-phosphate synthase large subunit
MAEIHGVEEWLKTKALGDLSAFDWRMIKQRGFSDPQIARALGAYPPCVPWNQPPFVV